MHENGYPSHYDPFALEANRNSTSGIYLPMVCPPLLWSPFQLPSLLTRCLIDSGELYMRDSTLFLRRMAWSILGLTIGPYVICATPHPWNSSHNITVMLFGHGFFSLSAFFQFVWVPNFVAYSSKFWACRRHVSCLIF